MKGAYTVGTQLVFYKGSVISLHTLTPSYSPSKSKGMCEITRQELRRIAVYLDQGFCILSGWVSCLFSILVQFGPFEQAFTDHYVGIRQPAEQYVDGGE